MVEYWFDTAIRENHPLVFRVSVKLEIINNFVGICRGFLDFEKEKFFRRNLTEKLFSFSTDGKRLNH